MTYLIRGIRRQWYLKGGNVGVTVAITPVLLTAHSDVERYNGRAFDDGAG